MIISLKFYCVSSGQKATVGSTGDVEFKFEIPKTAVRIRFKVCVILIDIYLVNQDLFFHANFTLRLIS